METKADTKIAALSSVGIDIGKELFHVVGLGSDGKVPGPEIDGQLLTRGDHWASEAAVSGSQSRVSAA